VTLKNILTTCKETLKIALENRELLAKMNDKAEDESENEEKAKTRARDSAWYYVSNIKLDFDIFVLIFIFGYIIACASGCRDCTPTNREIPR
jgi:hypothetical protein